MDTKYPFTPEDIRPYALVHHKYPGLNKKFNPIDSFNAISKLQPGIKKQEEDYAEIMVRLRNQINDLFSS